MSVYDHITRLFSYFYTATIDMIEDIRKSIKSLLFSEIHAPEEVRFNDDEIIQDTHEEFNLDRFLSGKLLLGYQLLFDYQLPWIRYLLSVVRLLVKTF